MRQIAAFIRAAQTPVAIPDGEYSEGEGHGLTEAQQRTLSQYIAAIPANTGRVVIVRDGVVSPVYHVA